MCAVSINLQPADAPLKGNVGGDETFAFISFGMAQRFHDTGSQYIQILLPLIMEQVKPLLMQN